MQATLRPATTSDAARLCEIYNYYVRETVVTFEEEPVSRDEMASRIEAGSRARPWLVADTGDGPEGYAYAAAWKARAAYRHTVETSIYLDHRALGRGLGRCLYHALLDALRQQAVHLAIGGIALPNPASVALHRALGFERVGSFPEVGYKHARWVAVDYWSKRLHDSD